MNNILITGVSRTGKSTLAKILKEYNPEFSIIPLDPIIDALKDQTMIENNDKSLSMWKTLEFSDYYREFIVNMLVRYSKPQYDKYPFIFESAHASYDMKHFSELLLKKNITKLDIINLTHPKELTVNQLLNELNNHDTENDWTFSKPKNELEFKLNEALISNKKFIDFCESNKLHYINTNKNRIKNFKSLAYDYEVENSPLWKKQLIEEIREEMKIKA